MYTLFEGQIHICVPFSRNRRYLCLHPSIEENPSVYVLKVMLRYTLLTEENISVYLPLKKKNLNRSIYVFLTREKERDPWVDLLKKSTPHIHSLLKREILNTSSCIRRFKERTPCLHCLSKKKKA